MASAEPPAGASISYRRQYRRCGKPRCPTCGAPDAPGHGPYWYAFWRQGGRMRSRYLGKHLPDGIAVEMPRAAAPRAPSPPVPAVLRVRTLGAFAVWRGSEAIPPERWRRRKVALLFKCLLSAPGYRLHREQIFEWLWPEAEPEAATRNLHATLHRLRSLLDTQLASGSYIRLDGEIVALRPTAGGRADDWLDAATFGHAAGVALAGRDADACRAALARYGGDYLPEEPYEDWIEARRDELRAQHLALLEHLARLGLIAGEREEAERCLREVLAREPTHEPAARQLMRALAEGGRRVEALKIYQALATRLREELALAPDAQTEALQAALVAQAHARGAGGPHRPRAEQALPEGTLTFLMTEIEGIAALKELYPAAMPAALRRHRALLAASIERQPGRLVKRQGDSDGALMVFTVPAAALAAACAIQQALLSEAWPDRLPIRVRMALHAGEAHPHAGEYVGTVVKRCAQLRGMAHGGQILLSQATAELVRDTLPEGVGIRPLGVYRLTGLERAEQVFQVLHPRLPLDFPPLPAREARRGNLPAPLSGLVGREEAIDALRGLLGSTRLLTLTGVGGIGKTRLAQAMAGELEETFVDGVWLVELASLDAPELVPQAIARTLGIRGDSGNVPGQPVLVALAEYLRERELLLLLDNCEHLVEACAQAATTLLAAGARVRLLATSREALGVAGELVWRVPPLTTPGAAPDPGAELGRYAAVRLFVARALGVRPGFRLTAANGETVARICRRLDGLPLATELAAARLGVLGVDGLAARLDNRFQILTGGSRTAPARQQTLRATMEWSYDLLSEAERLLFRRLAVFAGGWNLEAAESVCAGDGLEAAAILDLLARLVAKSLVQVGEQDEVVRYALLETVREYALERLEGTGEAHTLRQRHAAHHLALAETAEPHLSGAEQAIWLARLEAEHHNLRGALAWSLAAEGDRETGLRLARALGRLWWVRGYLDEGRRWLGAALAASGESFPAVRAGALKAAGVLAYLQGDCVAAVALYEEGLALFRSLGDKIGIAQMLNNLAIVAGLQGDAVRAVVLLEENLAVYQELGNHRGAGTVLNNLGNAAYAQGEFAQATARFQESLDLYRQVENEQGIAMALYNLGAVALVRGDPDRSASLLEESLVLRRKLGDALGIASTLSRLGTVARYNGDWGRATALHDESLGLSRELGDKVGIAESLHNLGTVAFQQGDYGRAAALYHESLALQRELGDRRGIASALTNLGLVAYGQCAYERATHQFEDSLRFSRDAGARDLVAGALEGLACVNAARGLSQRAARLGGAAQALREVLGVPLPPEQRAGHTQAAQAMRAAVAEDAFARAWAAGQALNLEQAVALALVDEAACETTVRQENSVPCGPDSQRPPRNEDLSARDVLEGDRAGQT